MKARVLVLIDTATVGGPGKGVLQLLRHAPAAEVEYVLCNFRYRRPRSEEFTLRAQEAGFRLARLDQRGVLDPSPIHAALRLLRRERCNLIQTHGYKGHVVAAMVSRLAAVPWLAVAHGWTGEDWKVRQYERLEQMLLRLPDIAVGVSPALHATLRGLRGARRRTELIPNAVDPDEVRGGVDGSGLRQACTGGDPQALLLGVFGRLSPEKGHRLLLEALGRIGGAPVHLVVVGDGAERDSLERAARRCGVAERVHFVGYQSAMRDYYLAVDALVLPSLTEGLPNVLLEAMALGKPALATSVGAVPEVIEDGRTGWLVQAGNVDALAEGLRRLLASRGQLPAMGGHARRAVAVRFCPRARAAAFARLYRQLLSPRLAAPAMEEG